MRTFLDNRLVVDTGDITRLAIDAIVNAANSSLMGGGGVDGAIHRAGGPAILAECKKIREELWPSGLPTGKAVITKAGNLPAKWVIHTAGPVWHGGSNNEEALLADAYNNSISLAEEKGLETLAFPAISTGVYGFPADRAAGIVSSLVKKYFAGKPKLKEIRLVFFSAKDMETFIAAAGKVLA